MAKASKAKTNPASYFQLSQQPLQALFFLLPLIVLYELGTLHMAGAEGGHVRTIKAYSLLSRFLEIFGVTGYYLPGVIVIVVLLCWHLARRDRWRFEPRLYGMMWVESLLLALPLLVWGLIFFRESVAAVVPAGRALIGAGGGIADVPDAIILSVGAGIYEELLFRLIAIALLHMMFCDLLALPNSWGATAAVFISALAFSYYHFTDLNPLQWSVEEWNRFFFISCAGVYLALIYVLRGFGIVAATHAVYDVLLVLLNLAVAHR